MPPRIVVVPDQPTVRIFVRRSKSDGQEFSLDTQHAGAAAFLAGKGWKDIPVTVYESDGVAGDDTAGLVALRRLLDEARPGDIVICRSHDRLGRDMLESANVIRQLIERGARLYYYATGEQIEWRGATDAAMSVLRGFAGQAELENIRARTKEAIRQRVKGGHLGGGACYGYTRQRISENGREYTIAVVNENQAAIVRRIFHQYAGGAGLGAIAKKLNRDRVPPPSAGRRGSGSWAPSAVRSLLRNERVIGWYIHGRVERVKKGGKRIARKADPASIIRREIPEWRIIDQPLWDVVQARFESQAGRVWDQGVVIYLLSGIARCSACGGSISICNTKRSKNVRVQAYGCSFHVKRGNEVCPVAIRQDRSEVEGALVNYLLEHVLTTELMEQITTRVVELSREESERTGERVPVEQLEAALGEERKGYRNLLRVLATLDSSDSVLDAEVRQRSERIRGLEADLSAARAVPIAMQATTDTIAREIAAVFDRLRHGVVGAPEEARRAMRALFRRGLLFSPDETGKTWVISGTPELDLGAADAGRTSLRDPTGT
jgi:site-specific DNA recombinase